MDVDIVIYQKLIEITLQKSVDFFQSFLKKDSSDLTSGINQGLTIHVKKGLRFSENISTFRHPDYKELLKNSIELNIDLDSRLFKSKNQKNLSSEDELIYLNKNIILLGDVGAGKTTTMKRLVRKSYEYLFSKSENNFPYSFPIVVRIGEIKESESLTIHICKQLGLKYETIPVKKNKDNGKGQMISYEYKLDGYDLDYALAEYLNSLSCILFLDGLDETNSSIRSKVFDEIKNLSQIFDKSKIILSSRYIEEISSFKQFTHYELCPLSEPQKLSISSKWLEKPDEFIDLLKGLPYYDLSDRPLFLTYLVMLYISNDFVLPNKAIDIYRQIILLVIKEWDDDKEVSIKRYSKYKSFDTNKKEDFLSELAFELTYSQNVKKSFEHIHLEKSYLKIYSRYIGLTLKDGKNIIKDIESLNGLIIETQNNHFEFSHISLQEYLCARFIVTIPFSREHYQLMNIYASPLAIANALSPRPDEWFAMFFILNIGYNSEIEPKMLYEFFDRLLKENIVFPKASREVGFALIYLKSKYRGLEVQIKINEFIRDVKNIKESILNAARHFNIKIKKKDVLLELKSNRPSSIYLSKLPIDNITDTNFKIDKSDFWEK